MKVYMWPYMGVYEGLYVGMYVGLFLAHGDADFDHSNQFLGRATARLRRADPNLRLTG